MDKLSDKFNCYYMQPWAWACLARKLTRDAKINAGVCAEKTDHALLAICDCAPT